MTACSTVEPTLQLSMLPPEIILHVCVFLDARFIVSTLSRVCKTLHNLLGSRAFWRGKIYIRWQDKFPAIPGSSIPYEVRQCQSLSGNILGFFIIKSQIKKKNLILNVFFETFWLLIRNKIRKYLI